ncbi:MAG: hypothetical protein GEU82_04555 [Luteitalea sp.]|nr:hypothetical protein [Luteitalea sp.]
MIENTCPNCENNIADLVISVAADRQGGRDDERQTRLCPHCGIELAIAVTVHATISRADLA